MSKQQRNIIRLIYGLCSVAALVIIFSTSAGKIDVIPQDGENCLYSNGIVNFFMLDSNVYYTTEEGGLYRIDPVSNFGVYITQLDINAGQQVYTNQSKLFFVDKIQANILQYDPSSGTTNTLYSYTGNDVIDIFCVTDHYVVFDNMIQTEGGHYDVGAYTALDIKTGETSILNIDGISLSYFSKDNDKIVYFDGGEGTYWFLDLLTHEKKKIDGISKYQESVIELSGCMVGDQFYYPGEAGILYRVDLNRNKKESLPLTDITDKVDNLFWDGEELWLVVNRITTQVNTLPTKVYLYDTADDTLKEVNTAELDMHNVFQLLFDGTWAYCRSNWHDGIGYYCWKLDSLE